MTARPLHVSLADDHAIFRRGLRELLEDSGRVRVVGEFATGRAVLNASPAALGEVLVLDWNGGLYRLAK